MMSVCTTYVGVSQKKIRKKLRGREIRGRNYERKMPNEFVHY